MVISWLIHLIALKGMISIIYVDILEAIWKELEESFSQWNNTMIFEVKKAISNSVQKRSISHVLYKLENFVE